MPNPTPTTAEHGAEELQAIIARLRDLMAKATPGDLSTAERHIENETIECPICGGDGEVEAADYCNIDGKALGVQFYGIGYEFGAHEALWNEAMRSLPGLLDTLSSHAADKAALEARTSWRDMADAPKDRPILVENDRGMFVVDFDEDWHADGWWMVSDGKDIERPLRGDEPWHWQPLPETLTKEPRHD